MSAASQSLDGVLLGIGNPLLDISAVVPQQVLDKYELKSGNAILADPEKHLPLYDELVSNYQVEYIAGGATQNAIRVAQWMLQHPNATAYIGSVGKDKFGEQLKKSAQSDAVSVHYLEHDTIPTGTCAVLVKDKERSLVANLAAANHYKIEHLKSEEIQKIWSRARFFYSAGFFLTVSPPSIMHLAEHAHEHDKIVCTNLAAPFIPQFFTEPLNQLLHYADFVFGNESEAEAYANTHKWEKTDAEFVALKLAALPKKNEKRPRVAVITQGSDATVVATEGKVTSYPVPKLDQSLIVDVNGAGDAFVGGFLSQLVQGKSIEDAVRAGHYAARHIIQVSGCVLKGKPDFQ